MMRSPVFLPWERALERGFKRERVDLHGKPALAARLARG